MSTQTQIRRITVKRKTPNPLFEKWLIEWRDQAKENDSKMQYIFSNALRTLRKYPLPLESGKDCIILKGFGSKLCDMLDKKLLKYRENDDSSSNLNCRTLSHQHQKINKEKIANETSPQKSQKQKECKKSRNNKSSKPYLPAVRSGGYAILIALITANQESKCSNSLSKPEIIERAQHLCDKSFTKSDSGSFYTAWSSMSTLVSKGLVERKGSPAKFSLTEEGEIASVKLLSSKENLVANTENVLQENYTNVCGNETNAVTVNDLVESTNSQNSAKSAATTKSTPPGEIKSQYAKNVETVIFAPCTFDIILLVDVQETAGGSQNPEEDEAVSELKKLNANFEVRHLKVGDFTWICRERSTKEEVVLPYIVERKRMDDLGHSIKDGRFHEQKFRLKQCGIQNLMYLVESYGSNSRTVLPLTSLMQGATNTLIQDKFQVKFTENHRHSMHYLSGFTGVLKSVYEKKTLMACAKEDLVQTSVSDDFISLMAFKDFNKGASKVKNFRVKDIFVRQLLQLKGISVEKALAIVEKYPTPRLLKEEYCKFGSQGEQLLANIQYGSLKKNIGPAISRSVYQLYTMELFS